MLHYKSLFASSLTLSLLCCAGWKIFLKDKILRSCVASSVSVLPMWFSSVTSPELDSEPWNSAPFKRDMGVCSVWCLLWNHQLIICVNISGLWMFSLLFFKSVLSGFTEVSVSGAQVIPDVGMDALGTWAQLLHGAPSLRWSAFLFSEGPGSSEEMAFWPLQTHFTSTNGLKTFFWSFCFLQKWDSMQCPLAWLFSLLLFSFGIAVWSLFDSGHTQLPL